MWIITTAGLEPSMSEMTENIVNIPVNDIELEGILAIPDGADGLVVFAHGSGSSRKSPRNNFVAGGCQP